MSRDRKWLVDIIANYIPGDSPQIIAEPIVDRLIEEGVLHFGYGEPEIDQVVEAFKQTFGTTNTSRYDRFAAQRLVKNYGSQAVIGIIKLLASRSTEEFAPIVNNISELEKKWVSVLNFVRKQSDSGTETIETA